jgi:hypothetical protein
MILVSAWPKIIHVKEEESVHSVCSSSREAAFSCRSAKREGAATQERAI